MRIQTSSKESNRGISHAFLEPGTLPGQTGGTVVTIQNLEIVKVDAERNLLLVKGNVPGSKKALVAVKTAVKSK